MCVCVCTASFRKLEETCWKQTDSSYADMQTWKEEWEELNWDTFSERSHASDGQVPCPQRELRAFYKRPCPEWGGHSAYCPPVTSLVGTASGIWQKYLHSGKDAM